MKYVFFAVIACIPLISIYINKNMFDPILLFSVPITISYIVNLIYYDSTNMISFETYCIYFLSVCCFVMGLIIGKKILISGTHSKSLVLFANNKLYVFCLIISIIGAYFAIQQILSGDSYGSGAKSFIDRVRIYTHYVHQIDGIAKYGIVFVNVTMLLQMYKIFVMRDNSLWSRFLLVFNIFIFTIYMATSFSRTTILYFFATFSFFLFERYGKNLDGSLKRKTCYSLLLIVGIMFFIFDYIAIRTNKAIMSSGESWWIFYFGSQFSVFDKYILPFQENLYVTKSLSVFGRALYKLDLIHIPAIQEIRAILKQVNSPVASFVSGPYLDYGVLGSIYVNLIYGIIIGYIYKMHLRVGRIWTIFYSTCVNQCLIAFFAFCFGDSLQIYTMITLALMFMIRIDNGGRIKILKM